MSAFEFYDEASEAELLQEDTDNKLRAIDNVRGLLASAERKLREGERMFEQSAEVDLFDAIQALTEVA